VLLLGGLRRVHCRELWRDAGLAGVIGLAGAAPYLSTLLHWVGTGGAYSVGLQDEQVLQNSTAASASIGGAASTLVVFALNALGTDLPIRLVLGAIGVWWVFRTSTGRSVVVIGLIFTGLGLVLNLPNGLSAVHQVYALTFPWGMGYRLLMIMALAQALLAGAGGVVALTWLAGRARRPSAGGRRLGRVTRLGVGAWLGLTVWSTVLLLGYPAGKVLGYTADDAAAMAWLRDHAMPGEVMLNDGYADAGIWAPYKAGVPILLPRSASAEDLAQARLVIDNVDRLDQVPKARAVVCAMNIRYVYRGAKGSGWDARRFPSLDELRRSPALEEVFSSGAGVIFRIRQACL